MNKTAVFPLSAFKAALILKALLLVLVLTGTAPHAAADTVSDQMRLRQDIRARDFEPGGKYHLFGRPRGGVAGRLNTLRLSGQDGLAVQSTVYEGVVHYETRFSDHGWRVHSPFDNHAERKQRMRAPDVRDGFGVYRINWEGSEIHPANGYDGEQGGGYPAPKGAKDIYSYHVKGSITRFKEYKPDERPFLDRMADSNYQARDNFNRRAEEAGRMITEHDPNLNLFGNILKTGRGIVRAAANPFITGYEGSALIPSASDWIKDKSNARANRELNRQFADMPAEEGIRKFEAYAETDFAAKEKVDKTNRNLEEWEREYPNWAEAVHAGKDVLDAVDTLRSGGSLGMNFKKWGRAGVSHDFADAWRGKDLRPKGEMSAVDGEMAGGNKPATNPHKKSAEEMAVDLSRETGNKQSVGFQSGEKIGHIDLMDNGKGHYDKKTGKVYKAPHVQESPKQRRPDGSMQPIKKREEIRKATKNDIRTARKLAVRKGWLKK